MKKFLRSTSTFPQRTMLGSLSALFVLATPLLVCADINMTLNLERRSGSFTGNAYLYANGISSPTTYHRVESPNGIIYRNTAPNYAAGFPNLSFSALLNECTNGLWTLTLNVGDPSEEQYGFSVSIANVASNMFGDTTITNPADYAAVSTNQPLIEWSSTSLLPEVHIQVHNGIQPPEPGNSVNMVAPINSWTPPSPVLGGTNTIFLAYQSNDFSGITITVPTNLVGGAAVADWNADGDLRSYDFSHFVSGGGSSALGDAVDAPELAWTTGGDAVWFVQTYETDDGTDAAASDLYGFPFAQSWIETTVIGPGTLDFSWGIDADENDSLIVDVDGIEEDAIYEYDLWAYGDISIVDTGPVTVRWTFIHEDATDYFPGEAYLDQVVYTPEPPDYSVEMGLKIQRSCRNGTTSYLAFPRLESAYPDATTTHEIESPTGKFSGGEGTSSSFNLASLDAVIQECTNGLWSLYFNRNSPYEEEYTFSMSVVSLSTNDLPPVAILDPLDGATGVSTDPSYMWMGPASFDQLFVLVRDDEASSTVGFSSLPAADTTWTNAPALPAGTNTFSASYTSNNFMGLAITVPSGGYPLSSWDSSVSLGTVAYSTFVTTSGFVPQPVTILPPILLGGDFGLSFISQSGATHIVECTTNLVTGPWNPITNFPGNGTTNRVDLSTTNPAAFYRVETR